MSTQLWFRNPLGYMLQVEALSEPLMVWHAGFLEQRRMSLDSLHELHFGEGQPFRSILVDDGTALEIRPGFTRAKPYTRHPTWAYGVKDRVVERYLEEGEEMIVINGLPAFKEPHIDFYMWLAELQDQYPKTLIHIHGGSNFRLLFGMPWRSVDYDPMVAGALYQIILPCGKQLYEHRQWAAWGKWFRLINYDWRKINTREQVVEFNMTSAYWAAEFFRESINFQIRRSDTTEEVEYTRTTVPERGAFITSVKRAQADVSDMVICDACSLAPSCKLYREGSVCTLPGNDNEDLAAMFKSRNSQVIIDGLGRLLEMNIERLHEGRSHEMEDESGIDGEVTKLLDHCINQGSKIAKLRDPSLNKPGVSVNVGIGIGVQSATPQQIAAAAKAELEAQGYRADEIDRDMILAHLRNDPIPKPRGAIEAGSRETND